MENFVTLFDSNYLPQGISLYISIKRVIPNFQLWIIALDQTCRLKLESLNLASVKILNLDDLITKELIEARQNRSIGEFCWTLTPFVFDFVFDLDSTIDRVTYLDADLWFRKDPTIIFEEFEYSKKSVLITDHGYAPDYDQSTDSGQYCVQFLIFDRRRSQFLREIWKKQCLEWCFNRIEDGKFGDQKYLDVWPTDYREFVHVLKDHSLLLAPWNAIRFPYGNSVAWHFHGLKIIKNPNNNLNLELCSSSYHLPDVVKVNVYGNYIKDLNTAISYIG